MLSPNLPEQRHKMKPGLFGRLNGAMGVMPGDQPDYGMGDFPPMGGQQQGSQFPQRKGPFDTAPGQGFEQPQAAPKQGFMSKLPGTMADIGSILDDDDNGRSMQFRQDRAYQEQQALAQAQAQRQAEMEKRGYEREDYMFKQQYERDAPQYFMSGKDRVQYDPASGESNVLYDGPEQFEVYAQALGLEPGTADYTTALQDYVLKSSGPTAYDYDVELDGVRTANDIRRKGAPTYRQNNPSPPRLRGAAKPKRSARPSAGRPSAVNGAGKKVEWNGNAWVPVD
tara:strand:+ start:449 stop:1294 length:846 start_codon:yes stop_codon:yes gene_type:complete